MFLFLRLVLAHLTADFVLQPDEIYKAKKKSFAGAIVHYSIIFALLLAFCFPYLKFAGCWVVIAFAVISHGIQDEIKLRIRIPRKLNFVVFILDQIIHIACLSPVFFFKFANTAASSNNIFASAYNNNSLINFASGYILSMFTGIYLWELFKDAYLKSSVLFEDVSLFNVYVIKYGMFERFIVTTSFLHAYFLVFLFVPLFFRIFSKRLSLSLDLVFNLLYASLIGLLLRRYLPIF